MFLFALLTALLAGASPPATAIQHAVVPYTSSFDGVTLWMVVIYPDNARGCPMLAVMHGYSQTMYDVYPTMELLAQRGLFTVGPAMRGRNNSGGTPDDSAWELTDIVDAIRAAQALYPAEVDTGNVNIVGYSGGGGNVFGCMSRFPDTFRLAAAFFGMADYGYDLAHGWYHYGGDGCCQDLLRQRIGGAPEDVPDNYRARCNLLATRNNRYTAFQLYVDSEETTCPVYNDTTYLSRSLADGCTNVSLNMSRPGDTYRWFHGLPNYVPDLVQAFDLFVPGILAGSYPPPVLARTGNQMVLGYLAVASYEVVLGDGRSEAAELTYDIEGEPVSQATAWSFRLRSETGPVSPVSLTLRRLTPNAEFRVDDIDLTHGTERDTLLSSDASGRVRYLSFLDTESEIRIYRSLDPASAGRPNRAVAHLLTPFPSPSTGPVTIRWSGNDGNPGPVRVVSMTGRTVATLVHPRNAGGVREWSWNGRDNGGLEVPAGAYYFSLVRGPGSVRSGVVLVR